MDPRIKTILEFLKEKHMSDIPAVPITSGATTSEYSIVKNANKWQMIYLILGIFVAGAGEIVPSLQSDSKWATILGGAIILAGKIRAMLVDRKYVQGRNDLKLASMREQK